MRSVRLVCLMLLLAPTSTYGQHAARTWPTVQPPPASTSAQEQERHTRTGLIVGTAFISPFRAERSMARALLGEGEFIEVFVDTPLGVAEQRDPKGLYKKARRGELKNFTGIDSPYEAPENPELRVDTTTTPPEVAADLVVNFLLERGLVDAE